MFSNFSRVHSDGEKDIYHLYRDTITGGGGGSVGAGFEESECNVEIEEGINRNASPYSY